MAWTAARGRLISATASSTAVLALALSGCTTQSAAPKVHLQEIDEVHVVSPHLNYAREVAMIPPHHYFGVIAGAVTTCGVEGVNLTPAEMEAHPVTVTLWHQGRAISSVRLAKRSGFAFLIVGGPRVRFPPSTGPSLEGPVGWSPGFVVRTSTGFAQSGGLGGVGGTGEEVLQIASRPHIHPCYPDKPRIPDNTLVSVRQACQYLSMDEGQVSPATGEHAVMVTLTNIGGNTCKLFGYPGISMLAQTGRVLDFRLINGRSQYMSNSPPRVVTLAPEAHAYVEVAKYRCDLGELAHAATLSFILPTGGQQLTIERPGPFGLGAIAYCKGGRRDPGNLVSISPVSASPASIYP